MKVIADRYEMNKVVDSIDAEDESIYNNLNKILDQFNELKLVWQGKDADEFFKKAEGYVNYLKSVPQICSNLALVMSCANKYYEKLDTEYAERMKKVVDKNG